MDANITTMIAINKDNSSNSSYFFEDPVLGWAGNENSKKRFKSKHDLWTLQSTFIWANKKINQNKKKKKENSDIMIDKFFKLSNIKKTKINLLKEYRHSLISSVVTGKIRITEDMI